MAIFQRGPLFFMNSLSNGVDITITFSTLVPPREDDYVVVFGGHGAAEPTLADPVTGGYTLINKHETTAPIFGMWYKKMTSTPDLDVTGDGGGNVSDGVVYGCYVLGGVDSVNPLDVPAVAVGPINSEDPDPGSIETVTNNAWVIACAGAENQEFNPGEISGYSDQLFEGVGDINSFTAAVARFEKVILGAEDPGAWPSWVPGDWYAITAAFRAAPPTPQPASHSQQYVRR